MQATTKVADLTVSELEVLIRRVVDEAIVDRLGDDDWPLAPELAERVAESIRSGEQGVPVNEVAARLGLDI
jgi:hypothetical protein